MHEIEAYTISVNSTIKTAVKKMDKGGIGFIACAGNDGRVKGIITDGDFRRAVLRGIDLNKGIKEILNRKFHYLEEGYSTEDAEHIFSSTVAQQVPVLKNGILIDILTKEVFLKSGNKTAELRRNFNVPVVIMAGGKGTRLAPFTNILPKPLIPVGEKPIIEIIMDNFREQGAKTFFLTVNYKGEMIKSYFDNTKTDYALKYIWEKEALGTAGSLKLLPQNITTPFIVSNCDIVVKMNYANLIDFHKRNANALTVVGSMQHYRLPYGIIELKKEGFLKCIKEKPEYDLLVNTGLYVLDKKSLQSIPKGKHFDMTDLIKVLLEKKMKIGVYPVSEKSYTDIGQWEEYKRNVAKFICN